MTANAGHEPPGHEDRTENAPGLFPVGLDGFVIAFYFLFHEISQTAPKVEEIQW
jgi:hypothetical protein